MNDFTVIHLTEITTDIANEVTQLLRQHVPETPPISIAHLEKITQSDTSYIFIAKHKSDKIIGMVTLLHTPKLDKLYKTEIEDLVVDESERGKGIGQALMRKAMEKAKELGATTIYLTSKASRVAANHLYKKLGFNQYATNNYKYRLIQ